MKTWHICSMVFVLFVAIPIWLKACGAGGLIFDTVVEREVFENSYQYQKGKLEQISIMEAQLQELSVLITDPSLDESQRKNIESQIVSIKVRLSAARKGLK